MVAGGWGDFDGEIAFFVGGDGSIGPGREVVRLLEEIAQARNPLCREGDGVVVAVFVHRHFQVVGWQEDEGQFVIFVEGVGPLEIGVEVRSAEGLEEGDEVGLLLRGEIESPSPPLQTTIQSGDLWNVIVVSDDCGEGGEAAIVHEGAVAAAIGLDHIAQAGRAGVGEVCSSRQTRDDAIVAGGGIDVELGRAVAVRASGVLQIECFAAILGVGVVGEGGGVVAGGGSSLVVFAIEGLDAADELGEGGLDAGLANTTLAVDGGEEDAIVVDGGQAGDEVTEVRVAQGATESHLDVVLDRLRCLHFEGLGPLVPKEALALRKASIDQAHRVTASGACHSGAGNGEVAEAVFLLMARSTRDAVVARKAFVVKKDAPQGGPEVGDGVVGRSIVAVDIGRDGLIGVIFQSR